MTSALESTSWPSAPEIPAEAKELLATFFRLVDDNSEAAAKQLTDDIFVEGGKWKLPFFTAVGKEDILNARRASWKGVSIRRHQIDRVFFGDTKGLDLLCLGNFSAEHEDGTKESADFAGRMLMEYGEDGKIRLCKAEAWAGDTLKA